MLKSRFFIWFFSAFICFCIITVVVFNCLIRTGQSAITYDISAAGRFGDQLTCYYRAKAVSYKHSIPLLYKYRQDSIFDQLMMHVSEVHYSLFDKIKFKNIVTLTADNYQTIKKDNSTLYILSWNFDLKDCGIDEGILRNKNFLQGLNRMIAPRVPLKEVYRPKNQITVAVHVRKGGGYDAPLFSDIGELLNSSSKEGDVKFSPSKRYSDVSFPNKFPPDQYYIDQIKMISKMFNDCPLYVHIFTDAQYPDAIVEKYKNAIAKPNITFACRSTGNSFDTNILEDFFAMAKFDCLIRPASSYSYMAEAIGDHKIVVFPLSYKWQNDKLIIDKVNIVDNREKFA